MAYAIEARRSALEVAGRCKSFREAGRETGVSWETLRGWAEAESLGRLEGIYAGHVGYGEEVDVTGVDARLPEGGGAAARVTRSAR